MKSVDKLRELGKHTEPCIWTADDVKSAVMIEKETFDKCLDSIEREVADMVPLPVDADGVPWHINDEFMVDEGIAHVNGIGDNRLFYIDGDGMQWTRADNKCHHHAPTVEDVLREFAYGLGVPVADSYVAATAAKLRLAGEDA